MDRESVHLCLLQPEHIVIKIGVRIYMPSTYRIEHETPKQMSQQFYDDIRNE